MARYYQSSEGLHSRRRTPQSVSSSAVRSHPNPHSGVSSASSTMAYSMDSGSSTDGSAEGLAREARNSQVWTESVPRISRIKLRDSDLSSGLDMIRVSLEWLERQEPVLQGLIDSSDLRVMKNDKRDVFADISESLTELSQKLIKATPQPRSHLHSAYSNVVNEYSPSTSAQYKARLRSLENEWLATKKRIERHWNAHERRLKIERSRGRLFQSGVAGGQSTKKLTREDEYESLNHSNSLIDHTLAALGVVNQELSDQQSLLKKTRKLVLDFSNLTGFGHSLMRVIGTRATEDNLIFYCGAVLITLLILFLWWYFG